MIDNESFLAFVESSYLIEDLGSEIKTPANDY